MKTHSPDTLLAVGRKEKSLGEGFLKKPMKSRLSLNPRYLQYCDAGGNLRSI